MQGETAHEFASIWPFRPPDVRSPSSCNAAVVRVCSCTAGSIATSLTEAVNGASRLTRVLVDGVSSAFALSRLDRATLLPTAGELFPRRDFSPIRRWCPVCLEHEPYDRLLWTFGDMKHCPRHLVALVSHANCGHIQRPWALHTSADSCAVCETALARADITAVAPDPLTAAYAEVIADLQQGVVPTRRAVAAGVRALMDQDGENSGEFACRTQLSRSAVLRCALGPPRWSSGASHDRSPLEAGPFVPCLAMAWWPWQKLSADPTGQSPRVATLPPWRGCSTARDPSHVMNGARCNRLPTSSA